MQADFPVYQVPREEVKVAAEKNLFLQRSNEAAKQQYRVRAGSPSAVNPHQSNKDQALVNIKFTLV